MDTKKKKIIVIYRCLCVLICIWCLYLNSGLPDGKVEPQMFVFFTILSNLACCLFFILLILPMKKDKILGRCRGAITMMITATFLIYHFVLVPQVSVGGGHFNPYDMQNVLAHYIVPILFWADWLLFAKKNIYRRYDPLIWLVIPLSYFGFLLVRAQVGGVIRFVGSRYPYFFVDVDALGIERVCQNAALALTFFALVGYLIFFIDRFHLENGCLFFGTHKLYGDLKKGDEAGQ